MLLVNLSSLDTVQQIGRLLEVQSASKSAITNKRRRTTDQVVTEAHTSSNVAVATFVRKGVLKTPSENITPRTVIHSILKAGTKLYYLPVIQK